MIIRTSENHITSLSSSLTKQMALLFSGRTAAFFFSLFIPIVLVRTLSVEEFGLYKQLFLVSGTLMVILRFGMEPSLYYFIPRDPEDKHTYISQTLIFYLVIGTVAFFLSFYTGDIVAKLVNNRGIAQLLPVLTFFTAVMLISTPLEAIMISLRHAREASLTTFGTELMKAGLIIGAAFSFGTVSSVLYALLFLGLCRGLVLIVYLVKGIGFRFNSLQSGYLRRQLSYSLPLFFAAVARSFSDSIHYYMVSYVYGITSFAIYSIGFLQLPLITIFFDSIVQPSLVRIAEFERSQDVEKITMIISDVVKKMTAIFLPTYSFFTINASEFITTLYTAKFQQSIPIFMVSVLTLVLSIFNFNYVLRALGDPKFLLVVNLLRLFSTVLFVYVGLKVSGLLGASTGVVISLVLSNLFILVKVKGTLKVRLGNLFPMRALMKIFQFTVIASGLTCVVKYFLTVNNNTILISTALIFSLVYVTLLYRSKLLSEEFKMFFDFTKRILVYK